MRDGVLELVGFVSFSLAFSLAELALAGVPTTAEIVVARTTSNLFYLVAGGIASTELVVLASSALSE